MGGCNGFTGSRLTRRFTTFSSSCIAGSATGGAASRSASATADTAETTAHNGGNPFQSVLSARDPASPARPSQRAGASAKDEAGAAAVDAQDEERREAPNRRRRRKA